MATIKGPICDFQDNVTIEELRTFSNKRMFLCFPVQFERDIIFCFCIFMRLLSGVARRRKVGGGHKLFSRKVKSKKKKKKKKFTAAFKRMIGYCE